MQELNAETISKRQKVVAVLPPVVFILSNLFLFGPFTIYQGNLDEFGIDLIIILRQFILPSLALLLILSAVGIFLPERIHRRYVSALFALGLIVWIQGNVLVWQYGVLNGQSIDWAIAPWRGWVDGIMWLMLLSFGFLFYRRIYRIARSGSMAMICLQLVMLGYGSITKPETWETHPLETGATPQWASEFSSGKNVIQLILDGVQSDVFEEIIKDDTAYYSKAFDGFTFFKEATGHFQSTHLSVPAILSGKVYQNDVPMRDFLGQTLTGRTTVNVLHEHGYEVDLVPWGEMIPQAEADHYHLIPSPYAGTTVDYERSKAAVMIDLALFRHVPHFVKSAIYNDQKWFIQQTTVQDERLQFRRFGDDAFLRDVINGMSVNRNKPVYKCFHLETTHPPFVTNEDCQYAGKVLTFNRKNMLNQIRCGLSTAVSFLEKLKSVGIYNNSLIIVQADHGYIAPVYLNAEDTLIEGYDLAPWMVSAALPLLLIKRPGSSGPLTTSVAPAMLTDIPATISSILNLQVDFPGKSVFDVKPTEFRERKFFFFNYSLVDWNADHLPPIDQYTITGSPFKRSSWHLDIPKTQYDKSYSTEKIIFGTDGAARFLKSGWSYKETDVQRQEMTFTWAVGTSASLSLELPKTSMTLTTNTLSPYFKKPQLVVVKVDAKEIGSWENAHPGTWETHSVLIRSDNNRPRRSVIEFAFSEHVKPEGAEPRECALRFSSLHLSSGDLYSTDKILFGTDDANQFLRSGWSYKEKDMRWAIGSSSSLLLTLPKIKVQLNASVQSKPFGKNQEVVVKLDGKEVGKWVSANPDEWENHSIPIEPDIDRPDVSIIEFTFSTYREPDKVESRPLALLFKSISVEKK